MKLRHRRRMTTAVAALVAVTTVAATWSASALGAGLLTVSTCGAGVFSHAAAFGINTTMLCPPGTSIPPGLTILTGPNTVPAGRRATWQANAPAGFSILGVSIPPNDMYSNGVNDGRGWGGGFYWAGGGAQTHDNEPSYVSPPMNSSYFGFQIVCGLATCNGSTSPAQLTVESINLAATETQGPVLWTTSGLWAARGWVRGNWPLVFAGNSPSGICRLYAVFNTSLLVGPTSPQDPSVWHQCAAPAFSQTVSTGAYGQGAIPLTISGLDAAGVPASDTTTLSVDNSIPSIALSGPQDAPTTAGVQYLTATATAGPSGVAGISCSLDGAPAQWHAGASAVIPVQGLGVHAVTCSSADNARDAAGNAGWSAPSTSSLSIRQPSISSIAFSHLVNALHCARVRTRVRIPARVITVHVNGQPVRVRVPAQTRTIKLVRCHPRYVTRRVRIHGHWRTERVPLLPHTASATTKHIRFGSATTVSGWLGTTQGVALGGQAVGIRTAPDDGRQHFHQVAVATTAANGSWSARLPAGPSRIIEADYDGSTTVEPSSGRARVIAPASVRLSIQPRHVRWGQKITLTGRLRGDSLPPSGETVILSVHFGGRAHDFAHVTATGDGRFRYVYTFLPGNGFAAYPFSAETVRESDYPYTPSSSHEVVVHVTP
jgi:hypothetical protein